MLKGKRFLSIIWTRPFYTISTHFAASSSPSAFFFGPLTKRLSRTEAKSPPSGHKNDSILDETTSALCYLMVRLFFHICGCCRHRRRSCCLCFCCCCFWCSCYCCCFCCCCFLCSFYCCTPFLLYIAVMVFPRKAVKNSESTCSVWAVIARCRSIFVMKTWDSPIQLWFSFYWEL